MASSDKRESGRTRVLILGGGFAGFGPTGVETAGAVAELYRAGRITVESS